MSLNFPSIKVKTIQRFVSVLLSLLKSHKISTIYLGCDFLLKFFIEKQTLFLETVNYSHFYNLKSNFIKNKFRILDKYTVLSIIYFVGKINLNYVIIDS